MGNADSTASAALIIGDVKEQLDLQMYIQRKFEEKIMETNLQHYHQRCSSANSHVVRPLYSTNVDKINIKIRAINRLCHIIGIY